MVDVTDVDPKVLARINRLAQRRFTLEVKSKASKEAFKMRQDAAKERQARKDAAMEASIAKVDAQIVGAIAGHRSSLIEVGRQSFATLIASFQFRRLPGKPKVIDPDGLMAVARKKGVVRDVADPPPSRAWVFNPKKFFTWLDTHGEHFEDFIDFIDVPEDGESLTMKPNGTHVVVHDGKRISPPSVTIKS